MATLSLRSPEQKRSKNNFATLDRACVTATGPGSNRFLLLSFKKEALASLFSDGEWDVGR